jgi:hypothetical protein
MFTFDLREAGRSVILAGREFTASQRDRL